MARRTLAQVDAEAREEFARLLEVVKRPAADEAFTAVVQAELDEACRQAWVKRFPDKRPPKDRHKLAADLGEDRTPLFDAAQAKVKAHYAERSAQVKAAEERMRELAPNIVLTTRYDAVTNYVADAICARSFPNQTQCEHYSEVSAKLRCEGYAKHAPSHVHREGDYFRIYVAVGSMLEVEVVKRLSGLTMREWLKRCLQLGANPRVYQPFLPHGTEEKLGMDHFGNDVVKS